MEKVYKLADKILGDAKLKDAMGNLLKEVSKYGEDKDGVLSFLIGFLAGTFDKPDTAISCLEVVKAQRVLGQIGLIQPMTSFAREYGKEFKDLL